MPPTVSSTTRGLFALPHACTSDFGDDVEAERRGGVRCWWSWRAEIIDVVAVQPGDGGRQQADRAGAEHEHRVVAA